MSEQNHEANESKAAVAVPVEVAKDVGAGSQAVAPEAAALKAAERSAFVSILAAASRVSQIGQSRWGAPVAAAAFAALLGWYAGAQSSTLGLAKAQSASAEHAFAVEMEKHAAALGAVDKRLGAMEAAGADSAGLKRSIDILARRVDEVGRAQTASAAQATARFDRSDKDMAQKLDRLAERIERIEKQVSSPAPVASIPNVSPVPSPQKLPELAGKPGELALVKGAEKPAEKTLRSYVLRDVFRGGALVEGRHGVVEVVPGADLPGAGRVRSVERRDGRWVVVTSAGIIDSE